MHRWLEMIAARQPVRRVMLDAGLHALAGAVDYLPRMRQRMAACELIEDVEYVRRGDVGLCLDILKPRGDGPHPVLIYLHGGAFAICSKRTHRALAAAYAAQGYVVCNVDYRLAPTYPYPASLDDACAAWLWVVDHVADHGGDTRRIALAGESAGANLALAVTLACCLPLPEAFAAAVHARGHRPRAALLYCGLLQVSQPERHRRAGVPALAAAIVEDAASSYLGRRTRLGTDRPTLADPLCLIEAMAGPSSLPPFFIATGLNDPVLSDSQRLQRALERLGSPCQAHYYPGETHAFHVLFWREQALRCWRDSFAFLQHHVRRLPTHAAAARQGA
jgi:acetyl esterase